MGTPIISVIIPVYNVAAYIEKCLSSICHQTYRNIEIIIVDDGSVDDSVHIAEKYLQTADISWRMIHQENQGQGVARDVGIREAKGDYVYCVDSDDTIEPTALETLINVIAKDNAEIVFSNYDYCDSDGLRSVPTIGLTSKYSRDEILELYLLRSVKPLLPGMLIQRDFVISNDLHVPHGCRYSEDQYLMWLLFSNCSSAIHVKAQLYHYIVRPGSTMTSSGVQRVLSGYATYLNLLNDEHFTWKAEEREFIVPRWVLGALRSSGRVLDKDLFCQLADQIEYRKYLNKLIRFPDARVKMMTIVLSISIPLFYWVLRIADK